MPSAWAALSRALLLRKKHLQQRQRLRPLKQRLLQRHPQLPARQHLLPPRLPLLHPLPAALA